MTFSHGLLSSLHDLQQSGTLTDFTVKAGDISVACHKVILAAACPYFGAMFRAGLEEARKGEVQVDSLDERTVCSLIGYFYSGFIQIEYAQTKELVEACEVLQLSVVKQKCEEYIIKNLSPNNCIGWCKLAILYRMESLTHSARTMMCKDFSEVTSGQEFKDLELADIIDYIKDKNIDVLNEDIILHACIEWVEYDLISRRQHFGDLLSHVYLANCTAFMLDYVISQYEYLMTSDLYKKFYRAQFQGLRNVSNSVMASGAIRESVGQSSMQSSIVLFGGETDLGINDKFWYLDTNSCWKEVGDMPTLTRSIGASICDVPDGLLLSGGLSNGIYSKACYMYAAKTKTWAEIEPMPSERSYHSSVSLNGFVYLIGGKNPDKEFIAKVDTFDTSCMAWKSVRCLPYGLYWPLSAKLQASIYIILNCTKSNASIRQEHGILFQQYNTMTGRWSVLQPLQCSSTCGSSLIGHMDKLYLVGGIKRLCQQYNPATEACTCSYFMHIIARY